MITECIILAGGLGTRLRSVVGDAPKCMAPVNGVPFISYVIDYLQQQGVEKFIFALGYKSEVFEDFLATKLSKTQYTLSIEKEPLGTGGAIQLACTLANNENIFATNGDTLFKANISALSQFHEEKRANCTLGLKLMKNFDRYGVVELAKTGQVTGFKEKQYFETGFINGGFYALDVQPFLNEGFGEKFSFEKDYLEKKFSKGKIYGFAQDAYFIDIGIPEDYKKAQVELANY